MGAVLTRISTMRGILTRIATMGRDFNTDYHNWGGIVFFAQCCVNLCSNDSCGGGILAKWVKIVIFARLK